MLGFVRTLLDFVIIFKANMILINILFKFNNKMDSEILSRLREVVDMNVGWQHAYNDLSGKVTQLELKLRESNQREVELIGRVDSILAESARREADFAKNIGGLLEDISILKIQATIYKEDFEIERKQRTELGGKLVEIQQELALIQEENKRRVRPPQLLRRIPDPVYCVYQSDGSRDEIDAVVEPTCMSLLYCPKCHMPFTVDDHHKLMDHMDGCN